MRISAISALWLAAGMVTAVGQTGVDPKLRGQLAQLFPSAASFSTKAGDPPHFTAYNERQLITGYAFWTTELEPLERGYDGPIKMLVGLDTRGLLTGVIVVDHHEPYGNFSIDLPQFPAQFRGKSIRDPFRVGGDIQAVSRATMTISSAARAVRNSARRIARQLLSPPPFLAPSPVTKPQ